MLDLLGKSYVVDHCIAFFKKRSENELYQVYTADALFYINEIIATRFSGKMLSKRYYDLLHKKPEDTRTAQEIVDSIRSKL